jgi:hypothetical protein
MRDLFSEYYRPTDEEFSRLWQDAIFVFDTNVLLRYLPDNEMVGIGGFCISPRNEYTVSGGYAKTPSINSLNVVVVSNSFLMP